jgi:acyl transferase domain-containing protein
MSDEAIRGTDIAVIGMAGRFPGAPDLETFWRNLREGVESISFFREDELRAWGVEEAALAHPRYVKARGVLDGAELFDAGFFGYSPREAETMDPQHRVFLECAWEALESAGYASERDSGPVGVFGSVGLNTYLLNNLMTRRDLLRSVGGYRAGIGNDKDYLATRVSYKLDLSGPSLTVQTACSSSLVAVHLACQSLLNLECDVALAGGVAINVPQRAGYWYEDGGVASPDGHCRAFDARAQGTVFGDGVGLVVLKRAADAVADGDDVLAIVRGSAINNDGGARIGYTAPGTRGQSKVVTEALAVAGVPADTVTYIEAHGTGTSLGDPIEITALQQAFSAQTQRKGFCALGSLKTNIGHLAEAAGVAGLIKAVLALQHRELPPSLNYERPNPEIDFAATAFHVNTALTPWQSAGPRRAGVSSFGIGGTNAHVVLEEAPPRVAAAPSRPWQLLVLSARTEAALDAATANLARHLETHPEQDLADVAHTLRAGRRVFAQRRAVVAHAGEDREDAVRALRALDPSLSATRTGVADGERPVAFLFPGQGAQRAGMARELYRVEPVFRREIDRGVDLLKGPLGPAMGTDLRGPLLGEGTEDLSQTRLTQPALFVFEHALARLWMSWGVLPEAMIGHSVGELVAACLAGVLAFEDAAPLVAERGRLMQSLPPGAMVALRCPAEQALPYLDGGLALAASNGPRACTVSGPPIEVAALEGRLIAAGIATRRLAVSHAFHSPMVEPVLAEFEARVRRVALRAPRIPFVSNVTGAWITDADAVDPRYWARQLRSTVRFGEGVAELLRRPDRLLLEVGPGRALAGFARQQQGPDEPKRVWSSLPASGEEETSDLAGLLAALGALWTEGAAIDWNAFRGDEPRSRVPLPTYPFERRRFWVDPAPVEITTAAVSADSADSADSAAPVTPESEPEIEPVLAAGPAPEEDSEDDGIELRIAEIWQELLGVPHVKPDDDFFALGGDSLLGTQLISRLQELYPVEIPLRRIFEEPTVARLAALVREELVRKLAEMSEEEAQQLV